jgi:hypothetical protein
MLFNGPLRFPDPIAILNAEEDERKKQNWIRDRLWHNGPHASCCKKCLQAGYVLALVRTTRLDLIGEFPELLAVYEELQHDGMLQQMASSAAPASSTARRSRSAWPQWAGAALVCAGLLVVAIALLARASAL